MGTESHLQSGASALARGACRAHPPADHGCSHRIDSRQPPAAQGWWARENQFGSWCTTTLLPLIGSTYVTVGQHQQS